MEPESPRSILVIGTIVIVGLVCGSATADPGSVRLTEETSLSAGNDPTPVSNSTLVTEDELFDGISGARANYTAALYFVDSNGTWYNASTNGSIGAEAPEGNVVPNVDRTLDNGTTVDETIELAPDRRPIYVWTVTKADCGTTVYDATTGEGIRSFPVPACNAPQPPTESPSTATHSDETVTQSSGTSPDESGTTVQADGPGFGVTSVAFGVLLGFVVLWRR